MRFVRAKGPFVIIGEVLEEGLAIRTCGAAGGTPIIDVSSKDMADSWNNGLSREMQKH